MSLKFKSCSDTHIGLKRANNQDALLVDEEKKIFSVADGLGGHLGGEVASCLALSIMKESISSSLDNSSLKSQPKTIISKAFKKANASVYEQSRTHIELSGMGTTMVLLWIQDQVIYIANVGDSRAYLHANSCLWQLTDDHVLSLEASKKGFHAQDENTLKRDPLTNSVGFMSQVHVDIFTRKAQMGDTYLLCSDGLHSMISNEMILDVLNSEPFEKIPEKCIIKALSSGGYDNISVVALQITSC